MRLEFLPDGADECPLLRFCRWRDHDVTRLRQCAEQLAAGQTRQIKIHTLPFIEPVGDISFTWMADPWDRGVSLPNDRRSFVMQLPAESWAGVASIIRPFERNRAGFDWLLPVTEVSVLLSWSGQW